MTAHLYCINCLTNLHVGSGETTYSIVDNMVARDTVLENVPVIPASGVKGALRDHCERLWGHKSPEILHIFGQESRTKEEDPDTKPGNYKFFDASLLARPLRVSSGGRSYLLTTTAEILHTQIHLMRGVGIHAFGPSMVPSIAENSVSTNAVGLTVEGLSTDSIEPDPFLQKLIANEYGLVKTFRDFSLPVVARNQLDEKGMSHNLWYEEVVPHKSLFLFVVLVPAEDCYFQAFEGAILQSGAVQFGGNASIGCGYSVITKVV